MVILGDSFTECIRVPERLRFCSVVERILRAQGKAVCIKNAGMSGANMMHHIFTLLAKIIPLHPKLVILVIGSIDGRVARYKDAYWSWDKYVSIFADTNITNEKRDDMNFSRSKYELIVHTFTRICKIFQIQCCFLARPLPDPKRVHMQEMALKIADQDKIHCIDFRSDLNNCRQDITYDSLHLNAYGSALFGKYLARALLEGHLL